MTEYEIFSAVLWIVLGIVVSCLVRWIFAVCKRAKHTEWLTNCNNSDIERTNENVQNVRRMVWDLEKKVVLKPGAKSSPECPETND